ncbi:MAG: cryptochrome/photolyase family protein [Nocardioides sp.]|nr:cryptochrome/photolyase family protein [Nocardioides sp.]
MPDLGARPVHLVMPHQLFQTHLDAPDGTTFVMVEHDLLFRQYRFHVQKLVLHRASMRRFAGRLREAGYDVEVVETDGRTTSRAALARVLERLRPTSVRVHDVVDDWLGRDLQAALGDAGIELTAADVLESPNFLTTRAQLAEALGEGGRRTQRMQHFYAWQRRRLDVLVDADGEPVGGKWSFDEDNRRKLPRGHEVPQPTWPDRHAEVDEAVAWVRRAFPDNPGDADAFAWPTSHAEAATAYEQFLAERFADFGPYEDALSTEQTWVHHSLLTPPLNIGLISPRTVLRRALEVGEERDVPLNSLEGFVRQVIGWREYMRGVYHLHGRRLRSRNRLEHARPLDPGWWTAETGLAPVDHVVDRVLRHGWAHHIERLMVLGNAMCLTRVDPDAAYEWFMEMFVDAYDWVMVPNVYAMSQFAAGEAVTTKPYVSGSNYLRKMSDYARGLGESGDAEDADWQADWDGLYWTFVRDHHDVFARNPRSRMATTTYERMDAATKARHSRRAGRFLG